LEAGIGGPLYVGVGGNDLSQAIQVGTWTVKLASGRTSVHFMPTAPYGINSLAVYIVCGPFDTGCLLQQASELEVGYHHSPGVTLAGKIYPTCLDGSDPVVAVKAVVDTVITTSSCPPPHAV
jgi:hypothetical protein